MSFLKRWWGLGGSGKAASGGEQGYRIDFDMMVKGSVYKRRSGLVRQFGVTVDGATRLVTSGDVVERPTYDALLAAGAIRRPQPPQGAAQPEAPAKPQSKGIAAEPQPAQPQPQSPQGKKKQVV